ncbi:YaiI/YqxD family protein [Methylobacterium organophilum]|uniref:YaiI/YqxD family protein n=1 Tax=Methylobacterium organophilum TaxID=410 RepID=UPI001F137629|nr:YaiI/YqxD family protein [Methylobacterium organophilum]UMY16547.1 YaiI/YqxD family protein [Methylobacterium organophilum]
MEQAAPASPIAIYVDADACPVKDETFRVAARYGLHVYVVANAFMNLPREPWIERVVVGDRLDEADDWIAERVGPGAIVITADVPLASRCVKAGAVALAPNGKPFSDSSVGMALATRNLMQELREAGLVTGGPKPFSRQDRSAFLGALDRAVMRLRRERGLS